MKPRDFGDSMVRELTVTSQVPDVGWLPAYEDFLLEVLAELGSERWDVSVTLCSDSFIRELNRDWRGKDEPTDVLSFEADPDDDPFLEEKTENVTGVFGALVISLDTLQTNSAYFEVDFEEELKRVSIHGLLHLMGWDHATNESDEPMLIHQEKVLLKFKERLF